MAHNQSRQTDPPKKVHLNIRSAIHQKLRVKCALADCSIQEFVSRLIEKAVKDVAVQNTKKGSHRV